MFITRGGTAMTAGSGGAAPTPQPLGSSANVASGFTARTLDTTIATFTSGVVVHRDAFNVQSGWQYITRSRKTGSSSPRSTVAYHGGLNAAPIDSITWVVTAVIEELA